MAKQRMNPRELNRRVRIETNSATEGGSAAFYDETASWETYVTVWAKVEDASSRKVWQAQQIHNEVTHAITIHCPQTFDITKEIRFVWTEWTGHEHTVYPMGPPINLDNRWYEFVCSEQVG